MNKITAIIRGNEEKGQNWAVKLPLDTFKKVVRVWWSSSELLEEMVCSVRMSIVVNQWPRVRAIGGFFCKFSGFGIRIWLLMLRIHPFSHLSPSDPASGRTGIWKWCTRPLDLEGFNSGKPPSLLLSVTIPTILLARLPGTFAPFA